MTPLARNSLTFSMTLGDVEIGPDKKARPGDPFPARSDRVKPSLLGKFWPEKAGAIKLPGCRLIPAPTPDMYGLLIPDTTGDGLHELTLERYWLGNNNSVTRTLISPENSNSPNCDSGATSYRAPLTRRTS